jgi:hypothetical protein
VEHLLSEQRVKLHPVELGAGERPGLVSDRVRYGGAAELVHERGSHLRAARFVRVPSWTSALCAVKHDCLGLSAEITSR